jgi:hypothetical protein
MALFFYVLSEIVEGIFWKFDLNPEIGDAQAAEGAMSPRRHMGKFF